MEDLLATTPTPTPAITEMESQKDKAAVAKSVSVCACEGTTTQDSRSKGHGLISHPSPGFQLCSCTRPLFGKLEERSAVVLSVGVPFGGRGLSFTVEQERELGQEQLLKPSQEELHLPQFPLLFDS